MQLAEQRVRRVLLHRRDGRVLRALVDRRRDAQTTAVDVLLAELQLARQFAADGGDDVALRPVRVLDRLTRIELRHDGLVAFLGRQPPHLDHAVERVRHALVGTLLGVGPDARIHVLRVVDDGGEERALHSRQLGDVLVEVRLRRSLDAVRPAPEVDVVEVGLQDLVLAHLLIDLEADDDLLHLAGDRLVLRQEVVLHPLLRQRRAALAATVTGEVVDEGARDARRGDAAVRVEAAVLGGDERVLHVDRHLVQLDGVTVRRREAAHLRLAVGVVDDGDRLRRLRVGLGDVDEQVEADEREHGQQHEAREGEQDGAHDAER